MFKLIETYSTSNLGRMSTNERIKLEMDQPPTVAGPILFMKSRRIYQEHLVYVSLPQSWFSSCETISSLFSYKQVVTDKVLLHYSKLNYYQGSFIGALELNLSEHKACSSASLPLGSKSCHSHHISWPLFITALWKPHTASLIHSAWKEDQPRFTYHKDAC